MMIFIKNSIKKKRCLCFPLIFISTVVFAESGKTTTISYADALKFALNNNPQLGSSKASIDAAYGTITETKGSVWPKLSLELNGARSNDPLNVFGYKLRQGNASFADFGAAQFTGPGSVYTKPGALNSPGYYSNFDTAFKLTVPLYLGGKLYAQQKSAEALLIAAQQGDQQARNQIAYQLLAAYEGVLTAGKITAIAKEQLARAKQYVKMTEELFTQSVVPDSDMLMAKAYLNAADIALSNAIVQSKNQLDAFRTILGKPDSAWIPAHSVTLPHNRYDTNILVQKALQQNAGIHAAEARIRAEKANIRVARSTYKPQVNLELRHDLNRSLIGQGYSSNSVVLGVQWTLFDAGERAGAVQKATANTRKAIFELDERRQQLTLKIRQLKRSEKQAYAEYQLSHKMIQQEVLLTDKLQQRFGRGLVPLSALLESQAKLTQARAQEVQALYTQKLAQARILMLANQLVPEPIK